MKKRSLIPFAFLFLLLMSMKDDKPAYKIFDFAGNDVGYEKMLESAKKADIVLFGEYHDNYICHWLELELEKDMHKANDSTLVLGAEMFENDNQEIMDEYLKGYFKESVFKESCRLWPNYNTDYEPLVEYAKTNHIPFIATNVPRRYASMVSSKGFEYLIKNTSAEAKKWMAPLPIPYDSNLKCYKDMLSMGDASHGGPNLPKAQALKDATMAYHIIEAVGKKHPKQLLHFNGAYHSNYNEGICWYIKTGYKRSDLKIVTISTSQQPDINILDSAAHKTADYIICVPGN